MLRISPKTALFALFCVPFAWDSTAASITSLNPIIDGEYYRSSLDSLFGGNSTTITIDDDLPTLRASYSVTQFTTSRITNLRLVAMEFDLSSIPAGQVIESAELRFYESADFALLRDLHPLLGYVGDGVLNSTDFVGPSVRLSDNIANGIVDPVVAIDVTDFLKSSLLESPFVGFRISNQGGTTDSGSGFGFASVGTQSIHSRLATNPNQRPELVVRSVPEPAPFVGLSIGCILLFCWKLVRQSPTEPNRIS